MERHFNIQHCSGWVDILAGGEEEGRKHMCLVCVYVYVRKVKWKYTRKDYRTHEGEPLMGEEGNQGGGDEVWYESKVRQNTVAMGSLRR